MAECKYYKLVRQVSYDSGVTWISLDEYQKGDLYENDSPDCGGGITQYKWVNVSGEYTCVGTTKYQKTKKQQSTDGGQTWTDVNPPEYSTGAVIERESSDCQTNPFADQYLTLVAIDSGAFKKTEHSGTFQYSKDEGNTWTNATSATSISVNSGDRVMFKGTLTPNSDFSAGPLGVGQFSASTNYSAEGNPMSLLFGDNFRGQRSLSGKDFALVGLFFGDFKIVSAENLALPATTLANYCYHSMFAYCRSLTSVPSNLLLATTLTTECYEQMFYDCRNLTTAPNLPATTLANYCYTNMFGGCTNLNYVKCLATNISATQCTYKWLDGVSSSGTFVKSSSMSGWSSGVSGIPTNWTIQNA